MANIAKSNISQLKSILESDSIKNKLSDILGKNASTFATSIVQIASQNEMLAQAEPNSVIAAAMTAATLNLPLNNAIGQAYIVPFNERQKDGSKKVKAQFILGYKGLKQLASRSGQFLRMNTSDVREGEIKFYDRLSGEIEFNWIEDEKLRESKKIVGYVSYFKLINGFESFLYMTVEKMTVHGKKFSQTFKSNKGLWVDDYEKMALKTVSKLHLNSGEAPLSLQMQMGIKTDQSVLSINEESGELTEDIEYVDNTPPEVDPEMERIREYIENIQTQAEADLIRKQVPTELDGLFMDKLIEKGLK